MRKAIVVVALVLAVAVAGTAATVSGILRRQTVVALEKAKLDIREHAKIDFEGGDVSVSLFPAPSAVIANLRLRKPQKGLWLTEGGTVRIVAEPGALLDGRLVARRVEIEGMRLDFRPADGASAWAVARSVTDAPVPLVLHDCALRVVRGANLPDFDVMNIDARVQAVEGTVKIDAEMAALGPASRAKLDAEWKPGTGRTGGDAVRVHFVVHDGAADALARLVPALAADRVRGGTHFDISAEGFIGERSTETVPGEPLKGRVRAEADIELFGLRKAAVFENGFTLDDRRWALDKGQGRWGERTFTYAGWVARAVSANAVNLRLGFKDVDVASVLADYGIAERWRPRAVVSGEVRMGGNLDERLTRYEARASEVRFDGWPDVPVSTGPIKVNGSLLAINAEAAGSFTAEDLQIGEFRLPTAFFGANWWRKELSVVSMGQPHWKGKVDAAISYKPEQSSDVTGGIVLHATDAQATLQALFPGVDVDLEGRIDASVQGAYDKDGLWYEGRVGMHSGSMKKPLLRSLVERIAAAAGNERAIDEALVAAHPELSAEQMSFKRMESAFSVRRQPVAVEISRVTVGDAKLRASGTLTRDRLLDATGAATIEEGLARSLFERLPALARLGTPAGTLEAAFRLRGPVGDPEVSLDPSFQSAVERASHGDSIEPFVAPPMQPLALKLEPLEEQFGY